MMQLLLNLLENAAKYSPVDTTITIRGQVEDGTVAVSVIDLGPGLTREQSARVFEKFYRVDSGPTQAVDGSGLGLALCKGVAEAHGGRITVDSHPGRGCVFTVYLPAMSSRSDHETALQEQMG
jgi:signal transduction histidine kinase